MLWGTFWIPPPGPMHPSLPMGSAQALILTHCRVTVLFPIPLFSFLHRCDHDFPNQPTHVNLSLSICVQGNWARTLWHAHPSRQPTISHEPTSRSSSKSWEHPCQQFHTMWSHNCCHEEPTVIPSWNGFFALLLTAVVIVIIHNGWPQRTLPLSLTVQLKCLCWAHRQILWPPNLWVVAGKKRWTQKAGCPWDVLQDGWPFLPYFPTASPSWSSLLTLFPHCFFLYFHKRIWHPDTNKLAILRY